MCGIACVYGSIGNKESRRNQIKKMVSTLEHRGPDGWGYYLSPEIVLGHSRLSIVDLQGGKQPMVDDNLIIVFNGEIYNYIELRSELIEAGISFSTTSDTEVVLKAYKHYGTTCFSKFNGQFAILIWDKLKKELIVARDRFSIRPLYYLEHNKQIYFASEMKAFDSITRFQRDFNIPNLFEHGLLWNNYDNNTVYNNIKSLPGGMYVKYKDGRLIEENKYYELGNDSTTYCNSYEEAEFQFKTILDDAVKLRLRSDVPVGAYLSGGIDSSVILNRISQHTSNKYKTFSVTFEDKEYDESYFQKLMVEKLNTEHHYADITYKSVDDAFPETIYHTERPVFRTAPVPLFHLSKIVNDESIKVVLTGEGADEILWGYDAFKEVKLLEFWSKFPDSKLRPLLIKKLYPHLNHYSDDKQFGMMRMFYEGFLGEVDNDLASLNIRIHNNKIIEKYLNKTYAIKYEQDAFIKKYKTTFPQKYGSWSLLQKSQYLEMKTLLAGYLLSSQGDRMSMAHSVEGRYPFLDHRLIDLLFNINENYKLKGFNQKFLLKKSFNREIPDQIINRPKRPYMSPDLRSFIRDGKLTDNAAFFLNETMIKKYKIFNEKWVSRFLKKFEGGIPENMGYRDNMIITFILSTQIAKYWALNPKHHNIKQKDNTVVLEDY